MFYSVIEPRQVKTVYFHRSLILNFLKINFTIIPAHENEKDTEKFNWNYF